MLTPFHLKERIPLLDIMDLRNRKNKWLDCSQAKLISSPSCFQLKEVERAKKRKGSHLGPTKA